MQGRATKMVLFREGGEGGCGRVGRDAKDDVVVGVDILFEAHGASFWREGLIREIKVAASGDLVSKDLAALESEFIHGAVMK